MFASTYKNTIKTLLRTPTFWMMLAVLFFIVFANNIDGLRSAIGKGTIADYSYHNLINNIPVSTIMVYPMPLFAIVSVVLLLNRDYGDMVYEIEKANNIKPRCYIWGRMAALLTVNAIIVILLSFFFLHARITVHGGVDGMSTMAYLCDSFVRLMRVNIFLCIPSLAMFIGLTYAVGAIFMNGFPALVASSVYVIVFYITQFTLHMKWQEGYQIYFRYFNPLPRALRNYLTNVDTDFLDLMMKRYNDTFTDVILGFCCLTFFAGLGILISYLRIRKRTI